MNTLIHNEINRSRRNIAALTGVALISCTTSGKSHAAKTDTDVLTIKDYAALRAYTGNALFASILNPSSRGEFARMGNDAGISDDGGTSIVDALGRTWTRLFSGSVSLEWYGAVGDGSTDDTESIVRALATGRSILCDNKTYCIKSEVPIIVKNQGRQVIEGGCRTVFKISKQQSTDLFRFKGAVALKNLDIDFSDGPARYPFRWEADAGHVEINNVSVKNLLDNDGATGTIIFSISPTGNTFELTNIRFAYLRKRGNGNISDASGSLNCIYIGGASGSVQGRIEKVHAESIHNINNVGEIIFEDSSVIYLATHEDDLLNQISIRDIAGFNYGKRLLKIHSSNVTIDSVVGHSTEGDTLGVIGFLTDQGLGSKQGCSASNVRAVGNMNYAFSSSAPGVKWKNIVASVQRGRYKGRLFDGVALLINGDETTVDGFWSDSSSDIAIGTSSHVVKNTILRNLTTLLNRGKYKDGSIFNSNASIGFDGLFIDGLTTSVLADAEVVESINLSNNLNGKTKVGRNLRVANVVIRSESEKIDGGIIIRHVDGMSLLSIFYINVSSVEKFNVVSIDECTDVILNDVIIKGKNRIGVQVNNCKGTVIVSKVIDVLASVAAIYKHNCPGLLVIGCDHSNVRGESKPVYQVSTHMPGGKRNGTVSGVSDGWTQYFDTSLNKPIRWSESGWVDSTGIGR